VGLQAAVYQVPGDLEAAQEVDPQALAGHEGDPQALGDLEVAALEVAEAPLEIQ